jgi:copper homeostasis protein (lipoprotein)
MQVESMANVIPNAKSPGRTRRNNPWTTPREPPPPRPDIIRGPMHENLPMNRLASPAMAALALTLAACGGDLRGPGSSAGTALPADAAHSSRNALDWAGTYRGVLPCADCEGIETVVTLTGEGGFREHTRYLGKDADRTESSREGSLAWSEDGSTVTLAGDPPEAYKVGENQLTRLALDGSAITGALADNYVLTRVTPEITGWRWTLVELRGQPVTGLERAPHMVLDAADGRTSGYGGCNSFSGAYVLDLATLRLRFEQMVSTLRACASGMDTEIALHEVFGMVDNFSLAGDRLTLNRARMAPLARFVATFPE